MQQHVWGEPVSSSLESGPADYGVGVDTEQVTRWRQLLPSLRAASHRRLFTAREHAYCASFADPAPVYAGHWCAKEAVFKALSSLFGTSLDGAALTLDEIEIDHLGTGCPVARLPSAWAELARVQLSISHDVERAIAFAVVLRRGARAESLEEVLGQQLASKRLG